MPLKYFCLKLQCHITHVASKTHMVFIKLLATIGYGCTAETVGEVINNDCRVTWIDKLIKETNKYVIYIYKLKSMHVKTVNRLIVYIA